MRTVRRILPGLLAASVLCGPGLVAASASADTAPSGPGQDRPQSPGLRGDPWRAHDGDVAVLLLAPYRRHRSGVPRIGKDDKVLVGAHDSTCTIKHGRPQMWFWSTTCDTTSGGSRAGADTGALGASAPDPALVDSPWLPEVHDNRAGVSPAGDRPRSWSCFRMRSCNDRSSSPGRTPRSSASR